MSIAAPERVPTPAADDRAHISRVPYLPGLDGMRAIAVVAVMIYHANSDWLPGGFLGVEMFFVISGYLITLLLIAERERTYRISLKDFWMRRARRLLPAVFTLMLLLTVWTWIFERDALGRLRGDVIAGLFYVSNWYQVWEGLGYTAAGDFAPLRHLWSLAVEEQFYLLWPLIMVAMLGRAGTRRVADVSRWVFLVAIGITVLVALLYHPGPIGEPDQTPEAYWWIGDRPISKLDTLYLSTITRAGGLLLGAALAMVWRPYAVIRGPLRNKGPLFDVFAVGGLVLFAWMCWKVPLITPSGGDSFLFRGGLFLCGLGTAVVIAAVAHRGAISNRVLGSSVLVWIGVRSYGLYLFHWPIYQIIRDVAGNKLKLHEFLVAMAITVFVTELSFRLIETPIRSGRFMAGVRKMRRQPTPGPRRLVTVGFSIVAVFVLVAGVALARAPVQENEIAQDLNEGAEFTTDLSAIDPDPSADLTGPRSDASDDEESERAGAAGPDVSALDEPLLTPVEDDDEENRDTTGSSVPEQTGSTVAGDAPASSVAPGSGPATTAPVVPATTEPPPPPPTQAPVAKRSLGLVTDQSQLVPMEIPPNPGFHRLIALGDSVMLGAAEELQALGFAVDAKVSRQMIDFVPTMQQIRANNTFGSVAVIHLGTNGPFSQETLDAMMATLRDVPIVILLTAKADRSWVGGNNQRTRALAGQYPNVTVLDWEVLAGACEGTCFYEDGIHLTDSGQRYYASLVQRALAL